METRTYTERSNARRAAKAAGVDPELVFSTDDGFTFPPPRIGVDPIASADERKAQAAEAEFSPATFNGPAIDETARTNGSFDNQPRPEDEDVPAFLKIPPEQRKAAWERSPPKAAPVKPEATMAKKASKRAKTDKRNGTDKNATLLKMLAGKGATVESLTKALDWLPHTLRARLSRLSKPKSKGGEGLKLERERTDGVTSYRIAS